jgi:hypothetical protein
LLLCHRCGEVLGLEKLFARECEIHQDVRRQFEFSKVSTR